MTKHKLKVVASNNGYEFEIKDVTGFGTDGYSADSLNVNNVQAIVLVLKNSKGGTLNTMRLEGSFKNDFMSGLRTAIIQSSDASNGWGQFKTDMYTVESYLITKIVDVIGLANYSNITGTGLDAVLADPFVVDDRQVYEVDATANTVGGTVLQLKGVIKQFFSKGGFGYKFSTVVLNYTKTVQVLFSLANMRYNTLQKDGEAENYAVLTGHLNVIKWHEDTGSSANIGGVLRDANILTTHLENKYFRI